MQAAERGVALVQRLLAFARKQHLTPRSVDIGALVSSIEDLLRRTLGPQIQLSISAASALLPARVDANQLELAILNLTINARDAMPEGGILCIGLETGAPAGVHPTNCRQAIMSSHRSATPGQEWTGRRSLGPSTRSSRPRIGSGSGLGLPMVQGFAAQSGGAVLIRSKPGEGTTVELWLPKAERAPHPTTAVEDT